MGKWGPASHSNYAILGVLKIPRKEKKSGRGVDSGSAYWRSVVSPQGMAPAEGWKGGGG